MFFKVSKPSFNFVSMSIAKYSYCSASPASSDTYYRDCSMDGPLLDGFFYTREVVSSGSILFSRSFVSNVEEGRKFD